MKRFRWPLQRLLDVTLGREQAIRAELAVLANRIRQLRQEVGRRRQRLRELVARLDGLDLTQRLTEQMSIMPLVDQEQRRIEDLESQAAILEQQRQAKTREFMQVRQRRQSLEKLRQQAHLRYQQEAARQEQKQTDEAGNVGYVRSRMARFQDVARGMDV